VTSNGITATENGNGLYTFNLVLTEGAVVTAIGCIDSDTQSQLPQLIGVTQSGAAVISPITTLIVETAIAKAIAAGKTSTELRSGLVSLPATELDIATTSIVNNLGLGDYKPTDSKTANYITAAKGDPTGTANSAMVMRVSLSVSTLLKSVAVSVGSTDSSGAISLVSQGVAESTAPIDLTQKAHSAAILTWAQNRVPSEVANRIENAKEAITTSVKFISSSSGDINIAIAAAKSVSTFLNDATESSIADSAAVITLTNNTSSAVNLDVPNCLIGTSMVGSCRLYQPTYWQQPNLPL